MNAAKAAIGLPVPGKVSIGREAPSWGIPSPPIAQDAAADAAAIERAKSIANEFGSGQREYQVLGSFGGQYSNCVGFARDVLNRTFLESMFDGR